MKVNETTPLPHLSDDELVLVYYREALDDTRLAGHEDACAECRERLAALSRVLEAVADEELPEPSADFESRMIANVLAAAKNEERGRVLSFKKPFSRVTRALSVAAAVAACLLLTFSVGRRFGREEEQTQSAAQTQQRLLLTTLGEHLSRSRVTLVELKNREVSPDDLRALQAAADNLVNASRLFRAAAERAGEGQIAGVMEETERLLVRFAAAPDSDAKTELEGLRKRVESRDLLFRLQVMETKVERREKDLLATPSTRTSL